MPELDWQLGLPVALALMVASALADVVLPRRGLAEVKRPPRSAVSQIGLQPLRAFLMRASYYFHSNEMRFHRRRCSGWPPWSMKLREVDVRASSARSLTVRTGGKGQRRSRGTPGPPPRLHLTASASGSAGAAPAFGAGGDEAVAAEHQPAGVRRAAAELGPAAPSAWHRQPARSLRHARGGPSVEAVLAVQRHLEARKTVATRPCRAAKAAGHHHIAHRTPSPTRRRCR